MHIATTYLLIDRIVENYLSRNQVGQDPVFTTHLPTYYLVNTRLASRDDKKNLQSRLIREMIEH